MRLLLGFVALPLGLLLVLLPGPAPALVPAAVPGGSYAAAPAVGRSAITLQLERDAMVLVNRLRRRAGCPALVAQSTLRLAARRHSAAMAAQHTLSHRVAGEPILQSRLRASGYTGATMLGEVIAVGPFAGLDVVRMWMASPLHHQILLDCRYRDFGAGVVRNTNGRTWWTIDLARH